MTAQSLVLDNSGPVGNINNDRVGTVPIILNATNGLTLIGNANGPVGELVGNIQAAGGSFLGGAQTITVNQPASGGPGQVDDPGHYPSWLGSKRHALPRSPALRHRVRSRYKPRRRER